MTISFEDDLNQKLSDLSVAKRLRERPVIDSANGRYIQLCVQGTKRQRCLNWASNDYLALAQELTVKNQARKAVRQYGAGSASARLLSGGLRIHRRLEERLAHWFGYEDALSCSSGFQANSVVLPHLADHEDDLILIDRLAHASLYDASAHAAARSRRFAHNSIDDLERVFAKEIEVKEARRIFVVVESLYSMDGDIAPLQKLRAWCDQHRACLIIDEAHAIGSCGPDGKGICAVENMQADILLCTGGKSLAGQGGFILSSKVVIEYLVNSARGFIFSTAMVPAASGAVLGALNWIREHRDEVEDYQKSCQQFREDLRAAGIELVGGEGPIIPILCGDENKALALSLYLREAGHYVPAIRPPTVPPQSCRVRITCTRHHTKADKQRLIKLLKSFFEKAE